MRLTPAHLDMATAALRAVLPLAHPADSILRHFFRENPALGPKERAFVAESVFGVLRHRFFLENALEAVTPRSMVVGYLARFHGVNLRELAPLVSEAEAKRLAEIKGLSVESQPLSIQAEFPHWLMEKLQAFMKDSEILELGRSMQEAAPLDLRVNTLLATRDEIMELLRQDGIDGSPTPYSPIGIRLAGKPAINRHELFVSGKLEVQDEGSQLLGYLLSPKRRDMVVDFCAGAGGKSLMLGALMRSQGRIYAFDTSEKRLNNLKPRLKRSGLSNLHPQLISGENDIRVKRLAGKIDRVLVDAPCSGLGTLRRNPDLKWRQSAHSIEELKRKQASILSAASNLVKAGGRLIYATCSFLPEENQEIVETFRATHPRFALVNGAELLVQQKIPLDTGVFLELSPQLHHTDGFFAAVLEAEKDKK